MQQNVKNFGVACGAASCIVFPQAIVNTLPKFFSTAAPIINGTIPGCTGVCGACGGSCVVSVGVLLCLGCCSYFKKGESL